SAPASSGPLVWLTAVEIAPTPGARAPAAPLASSACSDCSPATRWSADAPDRLGTTSPVLARAALVRMSHSSSSSLPTRRAAGQAATPAPTGPAGPAVGHVRRAGAHDAQR